MVQHEIRVRRQRGAILPGLALVQIAPFVEQIAPEACASYRLHELLRDDGVRVDVGAIQRHHDAVEKRKRFHQLNSLRTSTKWPATAAAAAIAGLPRWLRTTAPCRPSQLRFEVEAQRGSDGRRGGEGWVRTCRS